MAIQFVEVRVKPNANASALRLDDETGHWIATLKSPPVEGRANDELTSLVAHHFGCRKSAVSIKSGARGRTKLVKIEVF